MEPPETPARKSFPEVVVRAGGGFLSLPEGSGVAFCAVSARRASFLFYFPVRLRGSVGPFGFFLPLVPLGVTGIARLEDCIFVRLASTMSYAWGARCNDFTVVVLGTP